MKQCARYAAFIAPKGAPDTPLFELEWSSISWDRRLDDSSECSVTITSQCRDLPLVFPWLHEVVVTRDGARVWNGPVVDLREAREILTINARDLSAWWWRRWIHSDHTYDGDDVSEAWNDLVQDALAPDSGMNLVFDAGGGATTGAANAAPAGIPVKREYKAADRVIAGDQIGELSRTGVDWAVVNSVCYARPIELSDSTVTLADSAFTDPPDVIVDGMQIATGVATLGTDRTIIGVATGTVGDVGVLESTFAELTILDQGSADRNAQTRLDRSEPYRGGQLQQQAYIASGGLGASAPVEIDDLIPGRLFQVELRRSLLPVSGLYRLEGLQASVTFDGGGILETVEARFQPVGTTTV